MRCETSCIENGISENVLIGREHQRGERKSEEGAKQSYFTRNISVHVLQNYYKKQRDTELQETGRLVPGKIPRRKLENLKFLQSYVLIKGNRNISVWFSCVLVLLVS